MKIIHTESLSRWYGTRMGIESVDLEIAEGEIFGFLGPNGAGKTTTIRILLGFLHASRGRATIFGRDCWSQSPRIKEQVGYLPGDLRLYPWMNCRRALRITGSVRGVDLNKSGADLADRFQLETDLRVRKMSRGTRQKLGLVLALAHQPRLLILDEPTSGLDPLMQNELADCLRELASRGHTVFFSSHTLSEVDALCDRVAIVRRGRIIADETLESLRSRAKRTIELVFPDHDTASRVQLPPFLEWPRRDGRHWFCELAGPTPPLVQWAAQQPLEDISISEPDLESLFHKLYNDSGESK